MVDENLISRWMAAFPNLPELEPEHRVEMLENIGFKRLKSGDIAYRQGQRCNDYVMCIEGRTRVFKTSECGREILLYQVGPGETCVLTTSCLMAGRGFPAESSAETDVLLAALPAPVFHRLLTASTPFRQFVLNNYGDLLSSLITLVDEVAFASLDLRLARRLARRGRRSGHRRQDPSAACARSRQRARGHHALSPRMGTRRLGARIAWQHRAPRSWRAGELRRRWQCVSAD